MKCRLYVDQPLTPGSIVDLPADQSHYLRSVMRLATGDPVTLFNGQGGEYRGSIELLNKQQASISIESFIDIDREMKACVHIVQAACRSEKIETVLQKGTELGAASFQIVRSERTALKLEGSKLNKRLERWQKIVIEAAEQSERTSLPGVQWCENLSDINTNGTCYALHPESAQPWHEARSRLGEQQHITLAIGPEGGWSPSDLKKLKLAGFSNLTFGPRIMRTETAAPALLAAIQSQLDS